MAWTTPGTATAGEVLTAAFWNTQVRDNTNFLYTPPMCKATRTTNLSIASGAETEMTFPTEDFDTDGMHDTATNTGRITINTAGIYLVQIRIATSVAMTSTTAAFYAEIKKNGSAIGRLFNMPFYFNGNSTVVMTGSDFQDLAVNDYLQVFIYQDTGTAKNMQGSMSAVWVGQTA